MIASTFYFHKNLSSSSHLCKMCDLKVLEAKKAHYGPRSASRWSHDTDFSSQVTIELHVCISSSANQGRPRVVGIFCFCFLNLHLFLVRFSAQFRLQKKLGHIASSSGVPTLQGLSVSSFFLSNK